MDFFGINGWEFVVLLLLAMFIFGPDRLPQLITDGVAMVRRLRDLASNASGDLGRELGVDMSLEDLHPRALLRKHLLSEEDEQALRRPFEDMYRDIRSDIGGLRTDAADLRTGLQRTATDIGVLPAGPFGDAAHPESQPLVRLAYRPDNDAT